MTASITTVPAKTRAEFSNRKKLLMTAGAVGAIVSIAALGTFATFGGSTSANQQVASGSAGLDMPYSTFNQPIVDVLPGDSVERISTLHNPGTSALKEILLTTTTVTPSALTTDPVNGLQLTIDACEMPWRTVAGAADACDGATWQVLASPVATLTPGTPLASLQSVVGGKSDYLRATFHLPSSADATFQNLNAELDFQFDGVQRDGKYLN